MTWSIIQVQAMAKTRQDDDVTDRISLVYTETETKLLGSIWLSTVCDETR